MSIVGLQPVCSWQRDLHVSRSTPNKRRRRTARNGSHRNPTRLLYKLTPPTGFAPLLIHVHAARPLLDSIPLLIHVHAARPLLDSIPLLIHVHAARPLLDSIALLVDVHAARLFGSTHTHPFSGVQASPSHQQAAGTQVSANPLCTAETEVSANPLRIERVHVHQASDIFKFNQDHIIYAGCYVSW